MIQTASGSPRLSRRFIPEPPEPPKPKIDELITADDGNELRITAWYHRPWPMIWSIILSGQKPLVTVLCLPQEFESRLKWLREYATKQPVSLASDTDEIEIVTCAAARVIDVQLLHGHGGRLYGGRIGGAE